MAHDVFISYATKDKSVADAACHALEARGVRCWIAPRDIPFGSDWSEQIVEAIDAAGVLVLIFSSNANESSQVKRELSNAADKGIPILPLRIEDVLPSKGFRYYLGGLHWLDALSPPLEAHLGRLADRVSALLAADEAGASSSESRVQEDERPPNPRPGQTEQRPPRTHPSDSHTTQDSSRQSWRRGALRRGLVALIGALTLIGLFVGALALGREPRVPNLVGQTEAEARQSVGEDFRIEVSSTQVDDGPKGAVLSQEPEPGEPAKRGTAISVVVNAGQPPNPGDILTDDFSSFVNAWSRDDAFVYADGGYHIYRDDPGTTWAYASPSKGVEDVILEVDATRIDDDFGAPSWGIVCRLDPDSSDYYVMGIYNDGESFISRVENGESNIVLAEARSSDVVRGRSEVNHIRADCVGSKLTLYVNDRRLLEAEDSEYASGQSGLFVRNDSDNGSFKTNVLFDDYSISSP